jgi:cytochrome c
MPRALLTACALTLAQAGFFSQALAADVAHGKQIYETICGGCHTMDANRAGPAHRGVYGRKAGLASGFNYSPALKNSGVVWNEKTLDRWLKDPEAFIPGQMMGISVESAKDRADVIQYLKEESRKEESRR